MDKEGKHVQEGNFIISSWKISPQTYKITVAAGYEKGLESIKQQAQDKKHNSAYLLEIKYQIQFAHIAEEMIQYFHKQMDTLQVC